MQVIASLGAASLNLGEAVKALEALGNVAFTSLIGLIKSQAEYYRMVARFLAGEISAEEFEKLAQDSSKFEMKVSS